MNDRNLPRLRIGMAFDEVCAVLGQPIATNTGSEILGGKGPLIGVVTSCGLVELRSQLFFTKYASWQRPEGNYDLVFEHDRLARVSNAPEGIRADSADTEDDYDMLPARFVWIVTNGSETPQEIFDTMRRVGTLSVTPDVLIVGDVLPDLAVDSPMDSVITRAVVCALKTLESAGTGENFLDMESLRVRRFRKARGPGSAGVIVTISGPTNDPGSWISAAVTKKQREVCGKCGITLDQRLKEWNAPTGMVKIGSGRGAFMFCPQCEEGICGRCSIDLGMAAGCPQCRTGLVYMDGGRQ